MKNSKKIAGFLAELSVLTNRYDIVIESCGCSPSPGLIDKTTTDHMLMADELNFNYSSNFYDAIQR